MTDTGSPTADDAPAAAAPAAPPTPAPSPRPPAAAHRPGPSLRAALAELARDDPATAGRILLGLLPVQARFVLSRLDYDVTLDGLGTHAVTLADGRATVRALTQPRGRFEAEFHVRADPRTLAELLTGAEHHVGRFRGPVRAHGRHRRLRPLLRALRAADLALADALAAGARLDPALLAAAFPYAVEPSWTRGHAFTLVYELTGDPVQRFYVTARDGERPRVSRESPPEPPAASVSMSPGAFERLLRGEALPPGERPVVRGRRDAVAAVGEWLDRARLGAQPSA